MFHVPLEPWATLREQEILDRMHDAASHQDIPRLRQEFKRWDMLEKETPKTPFNTRGQTWTHLPVTFDHILRSVASEGNAEVVAYLLEKGVDINIQDIMRAIRFCHWGVVRVYMDYGWDINAAFTTPFMRGRILRKEEWVRGLLQLGADPKIPLPSGDTDIPNMFARSAPASVLRLLQEYGVDFTKTNALHEAASGSGRDQVESMIHLLDEVGFPIDQPAIPYKEKYPAWNGPWRGTALYCAVEAWRFETVQFLFERGADPHVKAENGKSAFELAKEIEHNEAIAIFEGTYPNE